MLKNILKLEGAQELNKKAQKSIKGGGPKPGGGGPFSGCRNNDTCDSPCTNGSVCTQVFCGPSNTPGYGWDWQCVANGGNA
ncbi:hypothetical protein ACFO3O_13210 [Dokdonia ponticola]|uniref:Bacteriocin n=1 Tax=Dokdonia ponticola TaxID=2041041 RepID=A0ABV9HYF0_9FLAO